MCIYIYQKIIYIFIKSNIYTYLSKSNVYIYMHIGIMVRVARKTGVQSQVESAL